jgi:hypothetical protein
MITASPTSSGARPKLTDQQMREFIARVKKQRAELIAEGVDAKELEARINVLEHALNAKAPADVKAEALDDLEAALLTANDGGVSRDVLNFFNQLLGTGMPPV